MAWRGMGIFERTALGVKVKEIQTEPTQTTAFFINLCFQRMIHGWVAIRLQRGGGTDGLMAGVTLSEHSRRFCSIMALFPIGTWEGGCMYLSLSVRANSIHGRGY